MKNLVRLVGILAVAILAATQARAVILAQDNFTYTDGDLATQSGGAWANFSGSIGAGDVQVVSGQASASGARTGDDQILLSGGPYPTTSLFYSFDLTVSALPSVGQGAYFAMFKDASTGTFLAKSFVTNVAGQVQLGVSAQANNPASGALWGTTYAVGTTHKIVVEFDQSSGLWPATTTMWVDPVNMASTSIVTTDHPFGTNINITAFAIRESNGQQGTELIDNLIVGSSFSDVVAVPEPSTMLLLATGLFGLWAIRRRS